MKRTKTLLRVLRAAQEPRMTQHQIARKAGMSRPRYWQIENGEGSDPSEDERTAVAAALGVKASEIAWPESYKAQAS